VVNTPVATQAVPPPASPVNLAISGFAFPPATVRRGATVTWTNRDPVAHDVAASSAGFVSPTLNEGESFSRSFDASGTISYICSIHPFMSGTITVQ
jgi:plastocyanin